MNLFFQQKMSLMDSLTAAIARQRQAAGQPDTYGGYGATNESYNQSSYGDNQYQGSYGGNNTYGDTRTPPAVDFWSKQAAKHEVVEAAWNTGRSDKVPGLEEISHPPAYGVQTPHTRPTIQYFDYGHGGN